MKQVRMIVAILSEFDWKSIYGRGVYFFFNALYVVRMGLLLACGKMQKNLRTDFILLTFVKPSPNINDTWFLRVVRPSVEIFEQRALLKVFRWNRIKNVGKRVELPITIRPLC